VPGTDAIEAASFDSYRMYARAVDEAAEHLHELEHAVREDLTLAALTLVLALGATQSWPQFAVPLLVGGMVLGALGVSALWRHWDLLDRLADQRDAYAIPGVRRYAARMASIESRRGFASQLRASLEQPDLGDKLQALGVVEELEALVHELDDAALALDPVCAIACKHLLCDSEESPLFHLPARDGDLRSRIGEIRSGFRPHRSAA
jgi:hypothetical protein